MLFDGHGVPLADGLHRLGHAVQFFLCICHEDDRYCHIEQALVILPHVIHDLLDLFFLHPLVVGDLGGKIVVSVSDPLLFDDVSLDAKILFLKDLCGHVLWDRNHIDACNGVDRQRCDLIEKPVRQTGGVFLDEQCPAVFFLVPEIIRVKLQHAVAEIVAEVCPDLPCLLQIKVKASFLAQMVVIIQHLHPLVAGQRNDLCAQLIKCLMHRGFDRCKLRLCFLEVLALDRDGQVALLLDPLSALMDLFLHDVVVDLPEAVKSVPLFL